MITGGDVASEARGWIGTRWQHQASLRGVATDCLGLIAGVGLALNLPGSDRWRADVRMRCYSASPNPRTMLAACSEYLQSLDDQPPQLGDILLMRFQREPQHFALVSCLDPVRIIHAYASIGRVVENGLDAVWRARIVRAYRYPGVA